MQRGAEMLCVTVPPARAQPRTAPAPLRRAGSAVRSPSRLAARRGRLCGSAEPAEPSASRGMGLAAGKDCCSQQTCDLPPQSADDLRSLLLPLLAAAEQGLSPCQALRSCLCSRTAKGSAQHLRFLLNYYFVSFKPAEQNHFWFLEFDILPHLQTS